MLSQPKNRVQAIKSKFENLSCEPPSLPSQSQLRIKNECERKGNKENSVIATNNGTDVIVSEFPTSHERYEPNDSYLYKNDVKHCVSESKPSLSRQSSDPGKKLHRSHAFRCDRTQKITSPRRSGSCNSRPDSVKMSSKLSKDRLKRLGDLLDEQMRKENFKPEVVVGEVKEVCLTVVGDDKDVGGIKEVCLINSIPDEHVPPHILEQYAQVIKPKRKDDKNEAMTDSGVSSETENLDDEKGRVKKITNQFECNDKTDVSSNNDEDLTGSSETMKLERKNPHLVLTDTLKKALKQPLPPGPPPKKPPRTFNIPAIPESEKKDTKRKLEKLEQVLLNRETKKNNIYDIAEENLSLKRPKEVHYLCTEILDITQRTLLPNQNDSPLKTCFSNLNCAITSNSTSSLPYTRLSSELDSNRNLSSCCSCSTDSLNKTGIRTLLNDKCTKCQDNEEKHGFKCHLSCKCRVRNSEFYLDEHIYDEPYSSDANRTEGTSNYGTINQVNGAFSKSMEELRVNDKTEEAVYDIPSDHRLPTDPASPKMAKTDFQKLLQNFEKGVSTDSPPKERLSPSKLAVKSIEDVKSSFKSKEDIRLEGRYLGPEPAKVTPDVKFAKKPDRRFCTEVRRYKPSDKAVGYTLPRKNPQLDVDRENLNALMNEIYETVTAACNMEEHKPGSFPTDQPDASSSEESIKLTRSLTEKRKNYVRRVSSRVAYLEPTSIKTTRHRHQTSICSYKSDIGENPYSTFRSWKSFRASQNNLTTKMDTDSKFNLTDSSGNILSLKNDFDSDTSIDNLSVDEKAGCVDIELPFEPRENGLYNVCLLVGLNYMTGEAYVRSVFPTHVPVPQHIENLIFPETLSQDKGEWSADAKLTQCYSFVLTDERGERSYGYCRRVLPEGASACLPLCYCLIGRYRAPSFYYKVLQEIESHHGGSDTEISSVLQQLFDSDFPNPGEAITLTFDPYDNDGDGKHDLDSCDKCKNNEKCKNVNEKCKNVNEKCKNVNEKCKNVNEKCKNVNEKCKNVNEKCKNMPDLIREGSEKYYDPENNNSLRELMMSLDGIKIRTVSRPLEPRAEESSSCALLDSLGAGLLVKVFGSLLLERKLIIRADKLSCLSSWLEALQSCLYPFVWQQPLISCVPSEIQRAVFDAPLPVLAGMLDRVDLDGDSIEEGMFIDMTHPSKVLCFQGDESTILPTNSYKTLKTSLQMESIKNKDRDDSRTRNVMVSEAFLRFFVDILGDFWRFFTVGVLKDGDMGKGDIVFDKDAFIKNASSKQNQYFLEWFTESAMFNHFIQNMAVRYKQEYTDSKEGTDSKEFSDLRLIDTPTPNFYQLFEERINSRRTRTAVDRSGYKNALNKRVKLLKARLKDLVG